MKRFAWMRGMSISQGNNRKSETLAQMRNGLGKIFQQSGGITVSYNDRATGLLGALGTEHRLTKCFNNSGGWLVKTRYEARKIIIIDVIIGMEQGQCNSSMANTLCDWEVEPRERVLGCLSKWTSREAVLRSDLNCRRQNASHITNAVSFSSWSLWQRWCQQSKTKLNEIAEGTASDVGKLQVGKVSFPYAIATVFQIMCAHGDADEPESRHWVGSSERMVFDKNRPKSKSQAWKAPGSTAHVNKLSCCWEPGFPNPGCLKAVLWACRSLSTCARCMTASSRAASLGTAWGRGWNHMSFPVLFDPRCFWQWLPLAIHM